MAPRLHRTGSDGRRGTGLTSGSRQLFLGGAVALSIWISPTSPLGSPLLLSRLTVAAAPTQAEEVVGELGGRVLHRFPPDALIVDPGPGGEGALAERLGSAWSIDSREIESPRGPSGFAFNRLLRPDTLPPVGDDRRSAREKHTGRPLTGDSFMPPKSAAGAPRGKSASYGPYGAGFWDGSEYFIGTVGVAVVLVESNGAIDSSTEDWTPTEEAHVASEVVKAMDWWISQSSLPPLSFTYEYHYGVPVSYEPITRPQSQESLWIGEALSALGYGGGDRFTESQNFVNDVKARLGTDWAFIIYVVD